eukprot:TRINITY_DN1762_c0_g3_i1.p1 TRINITY_DN1762_c0_g3~~TRINITY_DN1762_c0_g3_i1.p1  ORF type:complete len:205 (-),score=44.36 TRINITY_DN1762_c0_g3_i1:316-930(-)
MQYQSLSESQPQSPPASQTKFSPSPKSYSESFPSSFPSIATPAPPKSYANYQGNPEDIERGRDYDPKFEKESEKYHGKGTMRLFYGYDHSTRSFLGTENQVEQHRAQSLAQLVEPTIAYDVEIFSSSYGKGVALNNTIYRKVYQFSFATLAYTLGLLISCIIAALIATLEFSIQFFIRPCLKLTRMIVEIFVCPSSFLSAQADL